MRFKNQREETVTEVTPESDTASDVTPRDLIDLPPDDLNDNFLSNDIVDPFYGGDSMSPMEKHSDLLKDLTNFQPFIREKINGWLGLRWDEEQEKWIRNIHVEPIMNEKCASWCIDYLKTYTRNNNIITHISRDEYTNMVTDIIDVVWIDLGTRCEEFAIKNNGDLHRVAVELQHSAELVLMGAGDGKYNKLLGEVTHRSENVSYQGTPNPNMQQPMASIHVQPKKVGIFGKLKKALIGG